MSSLHRSSFGGTALLLLAACAPPVPERADDTGEVDQARAAAAAEQRVWPADAVEMACGHGRN